MTSGNKTVGLEHCLTPEGINFVTAALVRKAIESGTEEEFNAAFGMAKSAAARVLLAWELLRLPKWNADTLLASIPGELWPNRAAVLLHIRADLPETFAPIEGIEWAEENQYMPHRWVFRKWAEATTAPTGAPEKKAPHSYGVPKGEIIDGFLLDGKNWPDLLSHPGSYGKHYKAALCQTGRRGKSGAALWNPVIFARLLIERNDLNKGQVIARFKKAWPQLEDEMLVEIGGI